MESKKGFYFEMELEIGMEVFTQLTKYKRKKAEFSSLQASV